MQHASVYVGHQKRTSKEPPPPLLISSFRRLITATGDVRAIFVELKENFLPSLQLKATQSKLGRAKKHLLKGVAAVLVVVTNPPTHSTPKRQVAKRGVA